MKKIKVAKTDPPDIGFGSLDTTKDGFIEYIKEHPRKKFKPGDSAKCPVSAFLTSQMPKHFYVDMSCDYMEIYTTKEPIEMLGKKKTLKWMIDFIESFDLYSGDMTGAKILKEGIL